MTKHAVFGIRAAVCAPLDTRLPIPSSPELLIVTEGAGFAFLLAGALPMTEETPAGLRISTFGSPFPDARVGSRDGYVI